MEILVASTLVVYTVVALMAEKQEISVIIFAKMDIVTIQKTVVYKVELKLSKSLQAILP